MTYENLLVEKNAGVAWITINRPKALNALNSATIQELDTLVKELEKDLTITVAVIKGAGDKAFVAGADIKEMHNMTTLEAKAFSEQGHCLLSHIQSSRMPYIAMIQGYALGGGCELLMACDITVASEKAKLGQPEINLGISPGFGGTQNLPRLVGRARAKHLLLTGDTISAEEAFRIGLLTKVVPADELLPETEKLATALAQKSTVQTQFIKALVNKGIDIDLHAACALEISYFSSSFATHDQKEGMAAFLEKRKPAFKGK